MAKNKKDLFKTNLAVKPKPDDETINKVSKEINSKGEQEEKGFHIKFPMTDYQKLDDVSKKTHIPKKYLIITALKEYYEKHGH